MDGEGTFEILGTHLKSSTRIKVSNSYRPTVEWIHQTLGGSFYDVGIVSKKPIYGWTVCGEDSREVARMLLPFLREKRIQAEYILKYSELLSTTLKKRNLSDEIIAQRKVLFDECRKVKHAHY